MAGSGEIEDKSLLYCIADLERCILYECKSQAL